MDILAFMRNYNWYLVNKSLNAYSRYDMKILSVVCQEIFCCYLVVAHNPCELLVVYETK